jgi:predicted DNA-binding transcriptional regulator AlpA
MDALSGLLLFEIPLGVRTRGGPSMTTTSTTPAAQVGPAKKAAALKAAAGQRLLPAALSEAAKKARRDAARKADVGRDQHIHGVRAPPPVRLLDKHEVCAICGCTFQVIWKRMRAGTFPRSRIVGGKSMWLSPEIDQWLANLPVRPLKGDAEVEDA